MTMRCPRVVKRSPEEAQEVFCSDSEVERFRDSLEWFGVALEWFKRYTGVIQRFPGSALECSEVAHKYSEMV